MSRQTHETIRYAALRCVRYDTAQIFNYAIDTTLRNRPVSRVGVVIPPAYGGPLKIKA